MNIYVLPMWTLDKLNFDEVIFKLIIFLWNCLIFISISQHETGLQYLSIGLGAGLSHSDNKSCGTFYKHGLTLFSAWMSNDVHHKVWDEITDLFLNFNDATVEV